MIPDAPKINALREWLDSTKVEVSQYDLFSESETTRVPTLIFPDNVQEIIDSLLRAEKVEYLVDVAFSKRHLANELYQEQARRVDSLFEELGIHLSKNFDLEKCEQCGECFTPTEEHQRFYLYASPYSNSYTEYHLHENGCYDHFTEDTFYCEDCSRDFYREFWVFDGDSSYCEKCYLKHLKKMRVLQSAIRGNSQVRTFLNYEKLLESIYFPPRKEEIEELITLNRSFGHRVVAYMDNDFWVSLWVRKFPHSIKKELHYKAIQKLEGL